MYVLTYRRAYCPTPVGKPSGGLQPSVEQSVQVKNVLGRQQVQTKLTLGAVDDRFEQEAERVADEVMRMPAPAGSVSRVSGRSTTSGVQRMCSECEEELRRQPEEEEEELLQASTVRGGLNPVSPELAQTIHSLRSGRPLAPAERTYFEPRFGRDFSDVRLHTDQQAAETAHAINARAFTLGRNVVFGADMYAPHSHSGRRLLAHELTHVIQQGRAGSALSTPQSSVGETRVQRTLNDGHDLTSPRFSRITDLEAAYDEETVIRYGATGLAVQAIQQALYDLGYRLPRFGADGVFKSETKAAVIAYQRDHPPLAQDGEVGDETLASMDARFPAPTL